MPKEAQNLNIGPQKIALALRQSAIVGSAIIHPNP
jgi:hypothetical protein